MPKITTCEVTSSSGTRSGNSCQHTRSPFPSDFPDRSPKPPPSPRSSKSLAPQRGQTHLRNPPPIRRFLFPLPQKENRRRSRRYLYQRGHCGFASTRTSNQESRVAAAYRFALPAAAQWIAPSEKDASATTLEKRLWSAADQFRAKSGLTAAQYPPKSCQIPASLLNHHFSPA